MNLNTATTEQLDAYRESVAKVQGIDPLMLDYLWMDDVETGLRNRVLYAKRGVAEILRHKLEINVTGLVMHESDGWVMFTATGKDKSGRQEMAVGAAYLDGLKADKRAHGVMTAQTRAVRRLTLQFVTGGILDETEVQSQAALSAPVAASAAQLAGSPTVMPPPQVVPSAEPGKDITLAPVSGPSITKIPDSPDTRHAIAHAPQHTPQTQEQFEATQAGLRADAQKQLVEGEKKKRTNRKRNTVALESPSQQMEIPPGVIDAVGKITALVQKPMESARIQTTAFSTISVPPATANEPEQGAIGNGTLLAPALAEKISQPVEAASSAPQPIKVDTGLSPEKHKEYSERLKKYSQDILPKAGMTPSEGIGGSTMKLRKFAIAHVGNEGSSVVFSEEQWVDLFEFLDGYVATNGAVALVAYINKAIGVK